MVKSKRAGLVGVAFVLAAALGVALWMLFWSGGPEKLSAAVAA